MDKQLPLSMWPEWQIIEKIGEGSYGKVYKASREEQGKTFYSAIKIITIPSSSGELDSVRAENSDEQSVKEYFHGLVEDCIQEISTMEYFRGNSYVVAVEDYKVMEYLDDIGWDIYIRMEYLTGFLEYCAGKELTEQDVIRLGVDLCKALEYCQKQNIIHRDIKPENIFVSRFGEFKLGDFGIARELDRNKTGLSQKGTFSYMAPEMYRGEPYDSRVDIYSLGIVLYKLMNHNRLPFLSLDKQLITYRDKETALNRRMSGEEMPRPVDAGDELADVILKACSYYSDDRYSSPEEFREALENIRPSLSSQAVPKTNDAKSSGTNDLETEKTHKTNRASKRTEIGKPRKERRSAAERRSTNALIAAVIIMFIAVGIVIGVFVWLVRENAELQKLKDSLKQTVESAENKQLQSTLEDIRDKATEITENLNNYSWIGSESEGKITYMRQDSDGVWETMKVLIYPTLSEDGEYEEYFYWDQQLIFAYIWTDDSPSSEGGEKTDLYYFDDGELVRWIDEDNVCHDNETDNDEFVSRGEKYLSRANLYCIESASEENEDYSYDYDNG